MEIIRKVVAGLVALTACLIYVHASHAAAPQQKEQGHVCVPANYSVPR